MKTLLKVILTCFVVFGRNVIGEITIDADNSGFFAGKDATGFDRGGDSTPERVTLILNTEQVFVGVFGTVDLDKSPETQNVTLTFRIEGEGGFQVEDQVFPVDSQDGSFTAFTGDLDENFLTIDSRGTKDLFVTITSVEDTDVSADGKFDVFVIGGFESVLPLIMLVIFALASRNVYVSMFFGIWLGSFIIEKGNLVDSFRALFDDHMIPQVTDSLNFRTIMFTLFLGGFIAMIKRAGGQDGFSEVVGQYATSPRKTQLAAVVAGVGLFFDDYSSVLILGSSFKKLTDKFHVSREKLAFVADATSAPIASVAPISSWIAFELSRIAPELDNIKLNSEFQEEAQDLDSEYNFFLQTIPSRYYPFFMLTVQVLLIVGGVEFGPMLYAERKTRLDKREDGGDGRMEIPVEQDYTTPADDTPRRAWNFFIPLAFFIISLLVSLVNLGQENIDLINSDLGENETRTSKIAREVFGNTDSFAALVYTTMGASLFALLFFLIQFKQNGRFVIPSGGAFWDAIDCRLKKVDDVALQEGFEPEQAEDGKNEELEKPIPIMYFTEGVNIWVEGFKNLVPAVLILCMAFTIKSIVTGLATDRLFTEIILDSDLRAESLPTIIFIVSSLLALATGTSFGTMSIMFPLVSFATFEKAEGDIELFTIALSSIMAGAVFGDHSSLISDTTILASIGSGCQIGAHVYTQFPYALWAGIFSIVFGTLPAGYGAPAGLMLFFGMVFIALASLFVGAPIVAASGRLDIFSELLLRFTQSESLAKAKEDTRKFAAANQDMVDPEPLDVIKGLFGTVYNRSYELGGKKRDTAAELEEIAQGAEEPVAAKELEAAPAAKPDL